MNKLTFCIILTIGTLVAGACSDGKGVRDSIDRIDTAMQSGDFTHAQSECDRLLRSTPCLDSLGIEELCRMAVAMADLADQADERRDENAAQAVLCYRKAIEHDSIATMAFLDSLDAGSYRHVYLLNQLLRPITDREDGVIYTSDEDEMQWSEAIEESDTL